jgi:hypothetical protein
MKKDYPPATSHSPIRLALCGAIVGGLFAAACSPLAPSMRKGEGRFETHGLRSDAGQAPTEISSQPQETSQLEVAPQPALMIDKPLPIVAWNPEQKDLIPLGVSESVVDRLNQGEPLCLTLKSLTGKEIAPESLSVQNDKLTELNLTDSYLEFRVADPMTCPSSSSSTKIDDSREFVFELRGKLLFHEGEAVTDSQLYLRVRDVSKPLTDATSEK